MTPELSQYRQFKQDFDQRRLTNTQMDLADAAAQTKNSAALGSMFLGGVSTLRNLMLPLTAKNAVMTTGLAAFTADEAKGVFGDEFNKQRDFNKNKPTDTSISTTDTGINKLGDQELNQNQKTVELGTTSARDTIRDISVETGLGDFVNNNRKNIAEKIARSNEAGTPDIMKAPSSVDKSSVPEGLDRRFTIDGEDYIGNEAAYNQFVGGQKPQVRQYQGEPYSIEVGGKPRFYSEDPRIEVSLRSGGGSSENVVIPEGQNVASVVRQRYGDYDTAKRMDDRRFEALAMQPEMQRELDAARLSKTQNQGSNLTVGDIAELNFQRFKESGEELKEDRLRQADEYAASVGRTFDPNTGYSTFDPEILSDYREGQRKEGLDSARNEIRSRELEDRKAFDDASVARTQELDRRPDFFEAQADGDQDDRKLRRTLIEKYEREGLSRREARLAADDEMIDRKQRTEDREALLAQRERDIKADERTATADEIRMASALAKLNEVKKVSPSAHNAIKEAIEEEGYKIDEETGAIVLEEGGIPILGFGKEVSVLDPESPLYQRLEGIEGAEIFLAPPPYITRGIDKVPIRNIIPTDEDPARYFQKQEDGSVKQVSFRQVLAQQSK